MGTKTYVVEIDGTPEFTLQDGDLDAVAAPDFNLKAGYTYTFDHSGDSVTEALLISDDAVDGEHTDTDGEGTMGTMTATGLYFYIDDVLLEDIEAGDSAVTQFTAAITAGEGEVGGYVSSIYTTLVVDELTARKLWYYGSTTADMGGALNQLISSTGTLPTTPAFRDGTEHHPAPPASRLAGKQAVRSAPLQTNNAASALGSDVSDGTRRGSNNSGHPPLASGNTVGGGSKGVSS